MCADLDSVFWLSLSTLICGGFGLLIKHLYKIKCNEVLCCCGLMSFKRDVDDEMKIDLEKQETDETKANRSSLTLGFNNK